jgi:hypothetical protein
MRPCIPNTLGKVHGVTTAKHQEHAAILGCSCDPERDKNWKHFETLGRPVVGEFGVFGYRLEQMPATPQGFTPERAAKKQVKGPRFAGGHER